MPLKIRFVFISHSQVFPGENSLSDAKFCKVLQQLLSKHLYTSRNTEWFALMKMTIIPVWFMILYHDYSHKRLARISREIRSTIDIIVYPKKYQKGNGNDYKSVIRLI